VESVHIEENVQQDGLSLAKSVLNPLKSQEKDQQNKRLKKTFEKKGNDQAKVRKKKKESTHNITDTDGLLKV